MEKLILNKFPDTRKAPVRAQGLPGHVRPSLNSTAPSFVPLFSKHVRLVRFWGRGREGGSFHGSQTRVCHAKPTTRVFPNAFIVFPLKP